MIPVPITEVPHLPERSREGHKGSYGRVLVVAGSKGMSGAAVLCGRAALRGGAGLVQVATAACVEPVVAAGNPCYMTFGIREHADGTCPSRWRPRLLRLPYPLGWRKRRNPFPRKLVPSSGK